MTKRMEPTPHPLSKNRLEAFSDGVIAIIITIMVLELHIPPLADDATDAAIGRLLLGLLPQLSAYLLSFVVVGILWLNHHNLLDKVPHADSRLVWHNLFLLFAMSLVPLPTAFLAEAPLRAPAVMGYGAVMFLNAFAFLLLRRYVEVHAALIPCNPRIQRSNLISTSLYMISIPLALVSVYLSLFIFIAIPLWYFLPDRLHSPSHPSTND